MTIVSPDKKYESDGQFVFSCQYHVIFCPKYRRKVLEGDVATRLRQLVEEKQEEYGYGLIEIEVMPDHVHMLLSVNPKIGIYAVVSKIKGYTSFSLREQFPELKRRLPCLWTRSRFISSCGAVTLATVKQYIEDQKNQ